MSYIYCLWLASSIISTVYVVHAIITENYVFHFNRDNLYIIGTAVFLPALVMLAVIFVIAVNALKKQRITKVRKIVRKWENVSNQYDAVRVMDNQGRFTYKENLALMRENMHTLSDKDLKFLLSIHDEDITIDKTIKDALIDEMFERKILRE